jgi:hypothetical protein
MIVEAAAVLVCPIALGMSAGVLLRRLMGRRLAGAGGVIGCLLLPTAAATVLTVYFPLVGLWDAVAEGVLCGGGIICTAHRLYADPRNILVTAGSVVAALLLLELGARLFLGAPPAFPSGDGPSFFLANTLRAAAPDAAVFHAGGIPHALARTVLRADLAQPPGLVPFAERPPSAMLTAELVCSIAYGSAYDGFIDVSREATIIFPERFTPRPGATRRVLHIGDSMVFGVDIPRDQTFAADLEKLEPEVQHINGGISGMAPDDYLVVLRRWIARHQVDLAVIYLFEGNDLNGLDSPHPCSNWQPILSYADDHARLRFPSAPKNDRGIGLTWLLINSPMPYLGRVMIVGHSAAAAFVGSALAAWSARGSSEPDDVQLQHLESILRSARDELRERGIQFVVVVLPAGGRLRMANAPGRFSDQVLAISRRLGLHELDATEPIAAALGRGENPFQRDGTHFNEAGHRLMAKWLHERLAATDR